MTELQQIAIVVLGVAVIVAIGMWIARDARRRAPVADPDHPDGKADARRTTHQRSRNRARAKAARRSRRMNRKR